MRRVNHAWHDYSIKNNSYFLSYKISFVENKLIAVRCFGKRKINLLISFIPTDKLLRQLIMKHRKKREVENGRCY